LHADNSAIGNELWNDQIAANQALLRGCG